MVVPVLEPFDMTKIHGNSLVLTIAQKERGNDLLICDILSRHQTITSGCIIGTRSPHLYESFPYEIHEQYPAKVIKHVVRQQSMQFDFATRCRTVTPCVLVIDSLSDVALLQQPSVCTMMMVGANLKMLRVLSIQQPISMPPSFRASIGFVFIFRPDSEGTGWRIYNQFAGMFATFQLFCNTIDHYLHDDYTCLVIYNGAKGINLEDTVFVHNMKKD